jgi:tRNA A-37 threonylcarbamoyl transferase component Bud32
MSESLRPDGLDTPPVPLSPAWQWLQRWQRGEAADVAAFLAAAGPLAPDRVAAVLLVEQRERWRRGQRPFAEAYLAGHPEVQRDPEAAVDLIYGEFLLRVEFGDRPTLAEYQRRFPAYADWLDKQLALYELLHSSDGSGPATLLPVPPPSSPHPEPEAGAAIPSDPSARPAGLPRVPGYEVLAEVGRGGMGVVYRARYLALKRLAAVKVIRADLWAETSELARFRTEAEAIARLQHPHIVQIYEVGDYAGRPYLALEYVDGSSLDQYLDGTPQPARPAAELIKTLAAAMHHAHQRGIIHRDLKPANVLLALSREPPGEDVPPGGSRPPLAECTPKITDFGLAKLVSGAEDNRTRSGEVLGTPAYMAPEQAAGGSKAVGPAVDVYALGAILYECLTGRPPFKAATPLDTVLQVIGDEPVPPRQLQSQVPRDLETICLKCLHKEPGRRYENAEALAEDLRRFLAGQPVKARPVGRVERTWKWVRRRPVVAALLAAIVLVTAAGIVAFAWAFDQALTARDEALDQKNKAATALADLEKAHQKALELAAMEKATHGMAEWLLHYPLNQRLGRHVTPEKNANVLLWKAYGPHLYGRPMPAAYFQLMGIQAPPEGGQYFIHWDDFMKDKVKGAAANDPDNLLDIAGQQPWTPKQRPEVAQWLKANEGPLALAVQASKRLHYFSPLPQPQAGKAMALLGARFPGQYCREIGRALLARAMGSVADGRCEEAWQDLLACHRLARLISQGGPHIDALGGFSLEAIAAQADLALLESGQLSTKQLQHCLRDLQRLPPMPPIEDTVDFYDRYLFFEAVLWVERGGIEALEDLSRTKGSKRGPYRPLENVDWDSALRAGNPWYDRLVAAMRLPDRIARSKELARIKDDLKTLKKELVQSGDLGWILLGARSKEFRGKRLGEVLIGLLLPPAEHISRAADMHEQRQRNLLLAFALAAYRQDHGRYPEKLDALAPAYLPHVPQDLFRGQALIYRQADKGYLLYSVGPNGRDDQGRSGEDDPPGDDLVVRMPRARPPGK